MARSAAARELRSYENAARRENVKLGFHFAGFGGASVWTYPVFILVWFAYNAFTVGLPGLSGADAALGDNHLGISVLGIIAWIPGLILAIIGITRVKGRWWSIPGAALTYFLNPYHTMLWLLPYVNELPTWFHHIGNQIFGH